MKFLRRIPSVVLLFLGVIAAILSVVSLMWPWCAAVAAILTIVAVVAQYETQGIVVVGFSKTDWKANGASYQFSAGNHHGKGKKPSISVFVPRTGGGYEEVICDIQTLDSGEVVVGAGSPFDGEVRIS